MTHANFAETIDDNTTLEDGTFLTIVIPAYNEEKRLPKTISEILQYFAYSRCQPEIIIINDGSTDRTADLVKKTTRLYPHLRLINLYENKGKGHAVRCGILNAKGQYILLCDADLSTPISEVDKLIHSLLAGDHDIVIGSRKLPESQIEVRQSWYREFLGDIFSIIVRVVLVRGIKDTQCGFKCFTQRSAKRTFSKQRLYGFSFDVEVLYLARKYGFSIREVPVKWLNSPQTSVKLIRDSIKMFIDLFRIRYNDFTGKYDKSLSCPVKTGTIYP